MTEIEPMSDSEMEDFFSKAFQSQEISISADAMKTLCYYSAGFPKIMHIVGEEAYWENGDDEIDEEDAIMGVLSAAKSIGKKFVDSQVLRAIRSEHYHSIIEKIGKERLPMSFRKSELEEILSVAEKKNVNNFLQRMKKLNVLRSGDVAGEYVFNSRMVRLYFVLMSAKKGKK